MIENNLLKLDEVEVIMPKADSEAALKGAPRSIKEAISGRGATGRTLPWSSTTRPSGSPTRQETG